MVERREERYVAHLFTHTHTFVHALKYYSHTYT